MLAYIDTQLETITMYRLALWGLLGISIIAVFFSLTGIIFYGPGSLVASFVAIIAGAYVTNTLWAKLLNISPNKESTIITALILFLILAPVSTMGDVGMNILTAVIAISSKYVIQIHAKHLLNPAAAGAAIMTLIGLGTASWWSTTTALLPFIVIAGLLTLRKIERFKMFSAFAITAVLMILVTRMYSTGWLISPGEIVATIIEAITSWPVLFLGFFMLTEPQTTPPTNRLQMIYGCLAGLIFGSSLHLGSFYATPEIALIVGNLFSYAVGSKRTTILIFKKKELVAKDTYHFSFEPDHKIRFKAGQYMEWTLPHDHSDSRGVRRYFTIASSPEEKEVAIGIRVPREKPSSFKKALMALEPGDKLRSWHTSGDFVLPDDKARGLVFVAGGIGITPFRSMIEHLKAIKEKRDIVLLYACNDSNSFAYLDQLKKDQESVGLTIIPIITSPENATANWTGGIGHIDKAMIKEKIPSYPERYFYLSGPSAMVHAYEDLLLSLHIHHNHIKTDFFPGY